MVDAPPCRLHAHGRSCGGRVAEAPGRGIPCLIMTRRPTRAPRASNTQLTLRGLDPELEARLAQEAASGNLSLNQAALRLLRRGAGLAEKRVRADVVGASLDRFFGTWSKQEARHFEKTQEVFERVDAEQWT